MDEAIAAMARGDQDVALRGASIGNADAIRLAAALKLNTTITRVDLWGECQAGVLCARSFEVCGWRCRSCVSDNGIGGAGAASIAEALKLNTAITSVDLEGECRAGAGVFARGRLKCAVGVVGRVFQGTTSVARARRPSRRRWR